MSAFEYPAQPHQRRHGPDGYKSYESYRDWLRDEFAFRCVYCLHREQWYGRASTFAIDHFIPVSVAPDRACDYANLLYACASCNTVKTDILGIADPCQVAFGACLEVQANGEIAALNDDGERLQEALRLNSSHNVAHRRRWMGILARLKQVEPACYEELMGFPDDLPDLRKKQAPRNSRPQGLDETYLALRERGALPKTY